MSTGDRPGGPEPDEPGGYRAAGLELARTLARAAARMPAPPGRRRTGSPGRLRLGPGGGRAATWGAGGAAARSSAHPDERDPQPLDSVLGRLVRDHGWGVDLRVHGVFGRWSQLVGEDVAAHCTPETFDEGRLVVRTDSTAWATQLRLLAPTLVRRLNEDLGHGTVSVIEVLGPHLPSWKKGRLRSRDGRGPRDTYG